MTIFAVDLKITVVVEAESQIDAIEIAQNSTGEIAATHDPVVDDAWPVRVLEDLPKGWDGECFPYGQHGLQTRLELLFPPYTSERI